ncbi:MULTISPECIES: VanZ family protein [Xanthomonas]|uniref:VanZ family protein n=1 Tax=Xanthomonas TaxID=338 RepID=UPI001FD56FB7|nr:MULTISPECIES: VanZ family protein [unclassified Xanthomonas]WNH44093.1 VanZ family protein [Xanthomonas sp. A6251]
MAAVRDFRWPWLWLGLWWLGILVLIYVCMMPHPPQLSDLPDSDKAEHFIAYLLLAAAAVQVYAGPRAWTWAALGLLALGVGIEFAQGAWTTTRSADPLDALADALGVAAGMATAATPWRDLLWRLERGSLRRR